MEIDGPIVIPLQAGEWDGLRREEVKFDPLNIVEELAHSAERYWWWKAVEGYVKDLCGRFRSALQQAEAELRLKYWNKSNRTKTDPDVRPTADIIQAYIHTDAAYLRAKALVLEGESQLRQVTAMACAMRDRHNAIRSVARLKGGQSRKAASSPRADEEMPWRDGSPVSTEEFTAKSDPFRFDTEEFAIDDDTSWRP
jgi:hypothetical protein